MYRKTSLCTAKNYTEEYIHHVCNTFSFLLVALLLQQFTVLYRFNADVHTHTNLTFHTTNSRKKKHILRKTYLLL
jgi:hypothetical protein